MRMKSTRRQAGFVLIEALIALLIVSLGVLAMTKLESLTLSAAGESRARSEAITLSQKKMDELRNWVTQSAFTAGMVSSASPVSISGSNATYTFSWIITTTGGGSLVQLTTTWTDRFGSNQRLDLNSLVAWDNPYNQLKSESGFKGISAPGPSGDAKRGDYATRTGNPGTAQSGPGNVRVFENTQTGKTELLDGAGRVVLYLDKVGNDFQQFSTISGKVYFQQNLANSVSNFPSSSIVSVRLSSEGECFFDNTPANLQNASGGSNTYKYFEYKCYVGSGWWGNVGVLTDDNNQPSVCVGDPSFNGGNSNSTRSSAHPDTASVRTYRGFTGNLVSGLCPSCLSTGVQQSSNIPNDGTVIPGSYSSGANGQYHQDFLITGFGSGENCNTKMAGGVFAMNAGKFYCISPDEETNSADICPNNWPNFPVVPSGGGTVNYSLTLTMNPEVGANGIISSSPSGVSCDTNSGCTTQSVAFPSGSRVTLTPSAPAFSNFTGWTGACSSFGRGVCELVLSTDFTIGANFAIGITENRLDVSVVGSGTVTSLDNADAPDGFINCSTVCGHDFTASTVKLHAAPQAGHTFSGWSGGGCTGTSDCTVTMNSAKLVYATFTAVAVSPTLTIVKSGTGSGTVTYSAAGIDCGSTCSATLSQGTTAVLTAVPGPTDSFIRWTGVTCSETVGNGASQVQSNTQTTCTFTLTATMQVTAQFDTTMCITTISGTRRNTGSSVSVSAASCSSCTCDNHAGDTGYDCSVTAPSNTSITLTDTWTGHSPLTKTKNTTANCVANTGVNIN